MISAIIPVFNDARHVSRCLDSLLGQTYADWEAVCVDDGSTDDSPGILDSYAKKDCRFKVFHISNQGVSNARNYAMARVKGSYVMMIDSDDFIHRQTFEICMKQFMDHGSDSVMFTYSRPYRTKMMICHFLHLPEFKPRFPDYDSMRVRVKNVDDIFEWATEYSHPKDIDKEWAVKHCQPWRGVFKFSRICDIKFISGIIYEDFPWWSEVMLNLGKVTITNLPLYYYYPNFRGSVLTSSQKHRITILQKIISSTEKLYSEKASDSQKKLWEKNFLTPIKEKLARKMAKMK